MPRTYRLGKREAQKDTTRSRIVEAAIGLYVERGVSSTTLQDVIHGAEVAPGTLRNHFPTREALDEAIVERALAEMAAPDLTLFDGARSFDERIGRLSRATGEFIDRAGRWHRMWQREPMVTGA